MAVALGSFTNLASGTGTRSWSSPSTASKAYGVVVISGGAVEETTGVTWGGVAMSREYTGANTGGESGTTSIWFINAPGTGAQTVEITRSGATAYIATAFDGTSATGYAAVVTGNTFASTSTSAVPLDITIPSGVGVAIYGGLYSGENALSSITDAADMTRQHSVDFGNFVSVISQKTTLYTGTGAAYTGFNYTQSADDAGAAVIAIAEASAPANVTATPGVIALSTTAFIPTVTATANQLVTPGVAGLTLAPLTPTVSASAHVTATPATLALTAFAPTATASDHQTATPGVAALVLSAFAPSASAGGIVVGGRPPTIGSASNAVPRGSASNAVPRGSASNAVPRGSASNAIPEA